MNEKKEYDWIRSDRKTIAVQITADGHVIVRSPRFVSRRQVEQVLSEKSRWIKEQREKLCKACEKQYIITDEMRHRGINIAKKQIPERVSFFAGIMGVTYGRITIREQKTRWGSCSNRGNLNFNWKLMLMPEGVLDYVVVHELAHRIEMNHSNAFWKIVEQVLPDYRERKALLSRSEHLYK